MSTSTIATPVSNNLLTAESIGKNPDAWFEEKFIEHMKIHEESKTPSLSIVVTKGSLDWAYPPLILASTAAALGWEVDLFFTFYGLSLLKKELDLSITPMGNTAMPMKMPFGPNWLQNINWNIPNAVVTNTPGFEKMATCLMKQTIKNNGVASIDELRELSLEAGVRMIACQMTVELFGWNHDDFIPEVTDWIGAASFLPTAQKSEVSLFI
jgi:peroxiredoxin family protein